MLKRIDGWLRAIGGWIAKGPARVAGQFRNRSQSSILAMRRHTGSDDPPPLYWSPAHASTRSRFKATLTCSEGHGLVLKSHRVLANGNVAPSVVCRHVGCGFHRWVRLDGWSFGQID
jgi:hypothetical protein